MKTLTQVVSDHPTVAKLIRSVVRSIGKDSIFDVNSHGINCGFNGFIYYTETFAFYKKFRYDINQMVRDEAIEQGVTALAMVLRFHCLTDNRNTEESVMRCLSGAKIDAGIDGEVANALAWYAAEWTCSQFEE